MTSTTMSQRDHLIREDVDEELAWAPEVDDSHIGVSVHDGVVTLSGEAESYTEKIEANRAALRVAGVTVVANDLVIRNAGRFERTDSEVGAAIRHVLEWSADVPQGAVQVEVSDHVVTLTGTVDWNFQRATAERLVRGVAGVRHIENRIGLTSRVSSTATSTLIKSALVRQALVDANAISVTTVGSEATLTGGVSSWAEKNQAAHAAWSSPHITAVHNKIVIRP